MARGLMACADRGEAGEIYNLASGRETTIRELAEHINALTGNTSPVELKPARDWDRSGRRFGDPGKAKEKLGFEAEVTVEQGLERAVAWTRDNLEEIKRCMSQHKVFLPDIRHYVD